MNGVLNVLKPPGMTSFDVIAYLRGVLGVKKIGHTGTLDPAAVGVLPVCLGKALKAIEYMTGMDKSYRVELTLGVSTDTQDSAGKVIQSQNVDASRAEIIDAIESFKGEYGQVPPMHSAVKIGGKRLYQLAREGLSVERVPRKTTIFSIGIIAIMDCGRVIFDVTCSKGTYMRTLCADIGDRLSCGGHMSFLIRKRVGMFDIASALTLDEICESAGNGSLHEKMVKVEDVFCNLKKVVLNQPPARIISGGNPVGIDSGCYEHGETVRVYDSMENFTALGEIISGREGLLLKLKKVF